MTVFGWDASHYDGQLTPSILARARSEGIVFFSHKLGEGLLDTEGAHDDTALAAARTAGIPLIGGYLVPRSNASVTAQVDYWIKLADKGEPWWRDEPGWFWQIDLERWNYDSVPASVGIAAAQQLRAKTGKWTILYASRGQYGDQLKAWDGPLWNADYGPVSYPGDNWAPGWAPYSGKTPTFLQYTSSATIAGLTTCDRNAYRGTLQQLLALTAPGGVVLASSITKGDDMSVFLAIDSQGTVYKCDGMRSTAFTSPKHLADFMTLVGENRITLVGGTTPRAGWYEEVFGELSNHAAVVALTTADRDAIVAALPSADEVAVATAAELAKRLAS